MQNHPFNLSRYLVIVRQALAASVSEPAGSCMHFHRGGTPNFVLYRITSADSRTEALVDPVQN